MPKPSKRNGPTPAKPLEKVAPGLAAVQEYVQKTVFPLLGRFNNWTIAVNRWMNVTDARLKHIEANQKAIGKKLDVEVTVFDEGLTNGDEVA